MRIFASAMGQVDNVGDTVLRRAFLEALRPAGELQVFVGTRDDDYLSGLGLGPDDRLFRSSPDWRREIARTVLRERSLYAFNAGEMELRRSYALHYLKLAPLLLASRLRGGRAVHAGLGIRRPTPWRLPVAATLRLCDLVSWRDATSRSTMGFGRIAPDWAFATGSPDAFITGGVPDDRPLLAVSMRYDRGHPGSAWVASLRAVADGLGLSIVTVAQIHRDGPLATRLAAELGGDALIWDSPNHAEQEARLRAVYRQARLVVSDRLHAAVIALTEGALPLALADSPTDKVARTLAAAGIDEVSVPRGLPDAASALHTARGVLDRREPILGQVVQARKSLAALTAEIRGLAT